MKGSLFYLPSIGSRPEIEQGMAGMRGDLYRRMLAEVAEQAVLADDLGYDSISFTEHHLHVEGFELSTNPVLLDHFIGRQTKRIRVGQRGIVLPAENPNGSNHSRPQKSPLSAHSAIASSSVSATTTSRSTPTPSPSGFPEPSA